MPKRSPSLTLLAVGRALLEVEGGIAEGRLAVCARETRRMPLLRQRIQTVLNDGRC